MQPVVLLVGRMPNIGAVVNQLDHLPIQWLGAHDHSEVVRQLETEPRIECVIMGAGLEDHVRGDLIGLIAGIRPDICIYIKDRTSGSEGLAPFVERIIEHLVLPNRDREAA